MKILVVGANGFIGSRLCERLYLEEDVKLTALVRNIGKASRIGRMKINIVRGDVFDRKCVDHLVAAADVVISLLAGNQRSIVGGTRNLLKAAMQSSLQRFVHMSSAAVYGLRPEPVHNTEEAPLKPTANPYSDAKIKAEKLVARFHQKGLKTVMLRPRIVWGPYSSWVTSFLKQAQQRERFYLVDNGRGACNTIYIDNLIDAVFLAITAPQAVGQAYFVTDDHPLTWRQFYQAWTEGFGRSVDFKSVDGGISSGQKPFPFWRDAKRFMLSPVFRRFFREMPIVKHPANGLMRQYYALTADTQIRLKQLLGVRTWPTPQTGSNKPAVPIDRIIREGGTGITDISKIKTELGYRPSVSIQDGIAMTLNWLEAAGYYRAMALHDK